MIYDENGNLKQDKDNYYEYNELNQLVRVSEKSENGKVLSEYLYDYMGN